MKLFFRILKLTKPYIYFMAGTAFFLLLRSAANLASPLLIRKFIGLIRESAGPLSANFRSVNLIALALIAVYALRETFSGVQHQLAHVAGYGVLADLRVKIYQHLQKLSRRYYQKAQTGEVMSKITSDLSMTEHFIAHSIPQIALQATMLLGATAIMLTLNWKLALVSLSPVPLLIYLVFYYARRNRRVYRGVFQKVADISALLQDNISGMQIIQSFTRERLAGERFSRESSGHYRRVMKAIKTISIFGPIIRFLGASGIILIIWFGGHLVFKTRLRVEDLVAFLFYMNYFYQPLLNLGNVTDDVQRSLAGFERIFQLLDVAPDIQDGRDALVPKPLEPALEFHNVDFEYEPGIKVLKEIKFRVNPGQFVALVGPSGAGKSTIINLIPRFYDPTGGYVTLGGYDIRRLKLKFLRRQISMVLQDDFLFNGSVRDNLLLGRPRATGEELTAAARAANAHDFITAFPEGYDTVIGERGARLSGGQKQRIAIARAILKDASVLILDEATSAMDSETERLIQEAMQNLTRNRTTMVIAHRIATVLNADFIIVLDEGRIVDAGPHEELLERCELYRRLYHLQFRSREEYPPLRR